MAINFGARQKLKRVANTIFESRNDILTAVLSYLVSVHLLRKLIIYFYVRIYKDDYRPVDVLYYIINPINGLVSVFVSLFFVALYKLGHSAIEKYKFNNVPWPWVEDKNKFRTQLPKIVAVYIFNVVSYGIYLTLLFPYMKTATSLEKIPDEVQYLCQLFVMLVIYDFFIYWTHRIMHLPFIYKLSHKKHHEIKNTFHLSAVYLDWFDFFITGVIPPTVCL